MENQTSNPIIGYVLLDSFNNEDNLVPVLTDQDTAKLIASRRYVLIEETGQRQKKYFAQIIKGPLHTPEWGSSSDGQNVFPIVKGEEIAFVPSFHSYYLAKVLGEIVENQGVKMLQTAFTRPTPKSQITYIPKDELYDYLQLDTDKAPPIGILSNYGTDDPVPFYITDKLVNRQLGIFGSTGSGKSNTVIALAETLLERDWCVIIFDHAGEYYRMTEPSHETKLFADYWKDLGIIPRGIDAEKFRRFLPVVDGRVDKKAIKFSIQSKDIYYQVIKSMFLPLSEAQERVLDTIKRDLGKNYNGLPSLKKEIEGLPDGPDSKKTSDLRYMSKPILSTKISALENLGIFDGGKHVDPGTPDDLFGGSISISSNLNVEMLIKKATINVIDLGNVSNPDVINIIGLAVLTMLEHAKNKINSAYKDVKVAVFLEEAHTFFSAEHAGRPEFANSLTHVTKRIFKIGRKFWLNPVVISQQPADIPVGIMSQCVMRITHQLADERDIQIVGKGSAKQFTNMIPDLRKGECLVTTPEILAPQIIRIRPAMAKKIDPQTDGE